MAGHISSGLGPHMSKEKMEEILIFLHEYRWIYDFKLTRLFCEQVYKNIPEQWRTVFKTLNLEQLNQLPFGHIEEDWPDTLKLFVSRCLQYSMSRDQVQDNSCIHGDMTCSSHGNSNCDISDERDDTQTCPLFPCSDHMKYTGDKLQSAGLFTNPGMSNEKGINALCKAENTPTGLCTDPSNQIVANTSLACCQGNIGIRTGSDTRNSGTENDTMNSGTGSVIMKTGLIKLNDTRSNYRTGSNKGTSGAESGTGKSHIGSTHNVRNSGMSEKKAHEVRHMSELVDHVVRSTGCDVIIDVGSGLGYLGEELHSVYGHSVLGLEGKQTHTSGADRRASNRGTCPYLQTVTCEVTSDPGCQSNLMSEIDKWYTSLPTTGCCHTHNRSTENCHGTSHTKIESSARVCMVGLHCCGDLTPSMLHVFHEQSSFRALCAVSCCYHRMKQKDNTRDFVNLPMSATLEGCMKKTEQSPPATFQLSTYALRLAAQETRVRWQDQTEPDHDFHQRNVGYRAILELCLDSGNYRLKKAARKLAHKKDFTSFDAYIEAVYKHVEYCGDGDRQGMFSSQMRRLYEEYSQYFYVIQPLTALQYLLQPVLETLILTDRWAWLTERGYHSNLIPVFDDRLSPRNIAIVAFKDNI